MVKTILDVAKLAGVSKSTVSRYLNNQSISEEAKAKIEKVIKDENFIPNQAARRMRLGNNEVAIVINRINSPSVGNFLEGIYDECYKQDLTPIIYTTNFDLERENKYILDSISEGKRGIILMANNEDIIDYKINNMVVVGQKSEVYPNIYIDGQKSFHKLVDNVVSNNKQIKKVVIVGVDTSDVEMVKRIDGAIEVARKYDLKWEVIKTDFTGQGLNIEFERDCYYVAITDVIAYQIMTKQNVNLIIGQDYFVSGYGNYLISEILGLTTIDARHYNWGTQAIKLLISEEKKHCELEFEIMLRSSTGG